MAPPTHPTLDHWAKSRYPDGTIANLIEIAMQRNEIYQDMVWFEGNRDIGHEISIRTGYPTPTWTKFNQGIQPTVTGRAQVVETCGRMQALSEVDIALANLGGNAMAYRQQEDDGIAIGMMHDFADKIFHTSEGEDPATFNGFGWRFNDRSADNGRNIIDGGGTGVDNQSIWVIGWGAESCYGIYPRGTEVGMQVRDLGERVSEDFDSETGQTLRTLVYNTHFTWHAGLAVPDWRYIARVANLDKSVMQLADLEDLPDLPDLLLRATSAVESRTGPRFAIYCSRIVHTALKRVALNRIRGSSLTYEQLVENVPPTLMFDGIPIRMVDQLGKNEARIT